ncbi:MAG: hypothetical protein J0H99_17215, partial [Rhodospirillales bacterium]|nr:hypothetical protein [Rhodospirillales bacterium]
MSGQAGGGHHAPSRICLFAHYDPSGRIAPHVLHYLGHLASCGFAIHIACSGLTQLDERDRAALARIGAS